MTRRPLKGRIQRPAIRLAAAGGCLALTCLIVLSLPGTGDYGIAARVGGDNAGPGIAALIHGNLAGYVGHQPIIGLTSIFLRLPFVAIASAFGLGQLGVYRLGAVACLLPLSLVAGWLALAPGLNRDRRLYGLAGLTLLIMSPIMRAALSAGHPRGCWRAFWPRPRHWPRCAVRPVRPPCFWAWLSAARSGQ